LKKRPQRTENKKVDLPLKKRPHRMVSKTSMFINNSEDPNIKRALQSKCNPWNFSPVDQQDTQSHDSPTNNSLQPVANIRVSSPANPLLQSPRTAPHYTEDQSSHFANVVSANNITPKTRVSRVKASSVRVDPSHTIDTIPPATNERATTAVKYQVCKEWKAIGMAFPGKKPKNCR
jgi:hypothetical protein